MLEAAVCFEGFFDNLRFGSVVTARQTRELPRMEVITNKERTVYIVEIYSTLCVQSDMGLYI